MRELKFEELGLVSGGTDPATRAGSAATTTIGLIGLGLALGASFPIAAATAIFAAAGTGIVAAYWGYRSAR
ncbi:MAG: hypothetical protein FJ194_10320 [Gammaproteobacteria bacterium]|nr:hypothetical protein [Gammaproteobacteria bacterium]